MKSIVLMLLVSISSLAQDTAALKAYAIDFKFTVVPEYFQDGSRETFLQLAPQSTLLKNIDTSFNRQGNFWINESRIVDLGICKELKNKISFRIGFQHFKGSILNKSLSNFSTGPYDTIISKRTGQMITLDSTHWRKYWMDYYLKEIRISSSVSISTKEWKRFSLYAGIGAAIGRSYYNRLEIRYFENTFYNSSYLILHPTPNSFPSYNETHQLKKTLAFTVQAPLGINYRIANKTLFKKLNIFYEFQPTMAYRFLKDNFILQNKFITHWAGLKYIIAI